MKRISDFRKVDLLLSVSVALFFFWIFFKYMINFPINDDYSVLDNFNGIINADSFVEKIKLLLAHHNEHRIIYDKLWFYISYVTNGQIDFNLLALVGNLSLIGVFFVLAKRVEISNDYLFLFPIAALLFNLTSWENITFSMAGLSNFTVVLFSLLSLSFLTGKELTNQRFWLSVFFGFLAICTQGGGVFVVPVSLLVLALQKDYARLKNYAVISVLFFLFYFIGYQAPEESTSIIDSLLYFKMRSFLFSMAFLGSSFSFSFYNTVNIAEDQSFAKIVNDTMMLNAIIGFACVLFYAYLIKTKYYTKNLFNFSVMTLIIIISIVTGITRSQYGIETAYASRYRILSIVLIICIVIRFIEYAETKKVNVLKANAVILILSLFYFYNFNYSQEEYLYDRKKLVLKGILNYRSGNPKLLYGFEQNYCNSVLQNSSKAKTYFPMSKKELEKSIPYSTTKKLETSEVYAVDANQYIEEMTPIFDGYYIEGWAYVEDQKTDRQKVYIGISNAKGWVFYTTQKLDRYDLNSYFHKDHLEKGGFYARIKASDLAPGENKISVYIENKDTRKLIETDKIINK
jgi:hypothetical protein